MDFIKIKFGNDFSRLDSDIGKTVENMFRSINPMFSISESLWKPQMDIFETPDDIIILSEIAGVKKEDLEVEINQKAVMIRGKRSENPRSENTTYRLAEIQYGEFARTLFLPALIDTDKVAASYNNGMLKIRLEKLRFDQPKKIPIEED